MLDQTTLSPKNQKDAPTAKDIVQQLAIELEKLPNEKEQIADKTGQN